MSVRLVFECDECDINTTLPDYFKEMKERELRKAVRRFEETVAVSTLYSSELLSGRSQARRAVGLARDRLIEVALW